MPAKWEQYLATEADPAWEDVDKVLCSKWRNSSDWLRLYIGLTTCTDWRNRTPRFLFRGFNAESGGGYKGLNSQHRICPHAFLDQDDVPAMSTYDFQDLRRLINGHLEGHTIQSPFSSWSGDFQTALGFAAGSGAVPSAEKAHIVILDAEQYCMQHKVHHVTALVKADLASYDYPHEYLIYGPVSGSDYQCISLKSLTRIHRLYSVGSFADEWHVTDDEARFAKLGVRNFKEEVLRAQHMARSHMPTPKKTTKGNWSAFPIVFAVAELSRRRAPNTTDIGASNYPKAYACKWKDDEIRVVMEVLAHDIDLLYMPGEGMSLGRPKTPVNPWSYVDDFPQLRLMVGLLERLLTAAEWKCRVKMLQEISGTPLVAPADDSKPCRSCGSGNGEKRKTKAALNGDGGQDMDHASPLRGPRPLKRAKKDALPKMTEAATQVNEKDLTAFHREASGVQADVDLGELSDGTYWLGHAHSRKPSEPFTLKSTDVLRGNKWCLPPRECGRKARSGGRATSTVATIPGVLKPGQSTYIV